MFWRKIRFDGEQIGKGSTFAVGELGAQAVGGENGLSLRNGHLPYIAEGTRDETTTIRCQVAELLHGSAYLLTLRRGELLYGFGAFEQTLTLLSRHGIKLR